ncbi:MAG: magnesium transporter [Bacteroidota bacterium]|jgi:magnesium transporter
MSNETHTDFSQVFSLLTEGKIPELKELLSTYMPDELSRLLEETEDELNQKNLFGLLDIKIASEVFKFLEFDLQNYLLHSLAYEKMAALLNELSPDDRTKFLEELPGAAVKELLVLLDPEERAITLSLLGFPEGSVGRLMTTDYLAVKKHWTVDQVLKYIRKYGKYSETINVIYIIDDEGILLDDIRIREFLFVSPETGVSDLMDSRYVALSVNDDESAAITVFRNNNRVALPVINTKGVLLGIVTIDDVLRLAEEEDTEDIQKMGGTEALEEPYIDSSVYTLIQKRAGWLVLLFIGEMLTASAMSFFEDEIARAVILAMFVPLIISSGGNTGSQAASLIIRAMALGEIGIRDWWRVMKREFVSGLALGIILGIIGFFRIFLWTFFTNIYGPHWLGIALTVGTSLLGVVMWGSLAGSMLPLIIKRMGADPAVSSAPFIATLVDVTGLIIYFSAAMLWLKGTLL